MDIYVCQDSRKKPEEIVTTLFTCHLLPLEYKMVISYYQNLKIDLSSLIYIYGRSEQDRCQAQTTHTHSHSSLLSAMKLERRIIVACLI